MSKPRSDSWHAQLTDEQRHFAYVKLAQLGYEAGRFLIAKEFGIRVPSIAAISASYQLLSQEYKRHELSKALVEKGNIMEAASALGDVSKAVVSTLGQLTLDAAVTKDPERITKLVTSLVNMMNAMTAKERTALGRGKLEVLICERYLEWFKDAKAREIAESTAGNAEKIAALRREYFRDVDVMELSGEVQLPS